MGFNNEDQFRCLQCGNCCKAGYKVIIHPKDVKKWIKSKKSNSKMKLDENIDDFILNNHNYMGSDPRPLRIITFLSHFEKNPILIPKNYKAMWKGWKKGLVYILRR